jgi:hypothetical protein
MRCVKFAVSAIHIRPADTFPRPVGLPARRLEGHPTSIQLIRTGTRMSNSPGEQNIFRFTFIADPWIDCAIAKWQITS